MTAQSLAKYKKSVRAVQLFVSAIPLCGCLLKNHFFFPPFGDGTQTGLALTVSTLLAGTAALLPWKVSFTQRRTGVLLVSFALFILSAVSYFWLCQKYVISTSRVGQSPLVVSIGSDRSAFALTYYQNCPDDEGNHQSCTDEEMLQSQGPYEERVQKLWTRESILSVRLRLFLSYLGWLVPLNFMIGVFAKDDEPVTNSRSKKGKQKNL